MDDFLKFRVTTFSNGRNCHWRALLSFKATTLALKIERGAKKKRHISEGKLTHCLEQGGGSEGGAQTPSIF